MKSKQLSKQRILELHQIFSERDKAILASLQRCRYLLTGQIRRLHFADSKTPTAGIRAANRTLQKLRGYGVMEFLERRVGGVRAGSHSYCWTLTEQGARFLDFGNDAGTSRKRTFEPSLYFLQHTLAVAEVYIQLGEICKRHNLTLAQVSLEPNCWREYTDEKGKQATLKPDLFAVIDSGKYEDSYFFEVDRNTESPKKILEKTKRYIQYYRRGVEQKATGVFPFVVWIAPDSQRAERLRGYIADSQNNGIFLVIVQGELEALLINGAEAQKGEQIA